MRITLIGVCYGLGVLCCLRVHRTSELAFVYLRIYGWDGSGPCIHVCDGGDGWRGEGGLCDEVCHYAILFSGEMLMRE